MSSGAHDAGTQLHQCRSESETGWQGAAGDAFRDNVGRLAKESDDLSQRTTSVSNALNTFADTVDSIKQHVANLRGMATSARLTVTDKLIMPPGPEPGGAPTMPPNGANPEAGQQYQQQQAAYEASYGAWQRVRAFQEASTAMDQLRERETEAHRALVGVLKNPTFLDQYGETILLKAKAAVSASHTVTSENIEKLKGKFNDFDARLTQAQGAIEGPATVAERQAAITEATALQSARSDAAAALADMQQVGNVTKAMGGSIVTASAADILETSSSAFAKAAAPVAEKLPYVGVLVTAGTTEQGIAEGNPAAKEIEKGVGDTTASIAAGAAVGTCIGGPIGTVIGAGAGLIAAYGVDKLVDWKNGPIEQFNRWIGWE